MSEKLVLTYREAELVDIPDLIALLVDDELGKLREDASIPLNSCYRSALEHIEADPNNQLIIVQNRQQLIGMLQLTFIPYLTHMGSWRCLIEGVRIHKDYRGQGLGTRLFEWAIERAEERGCALVQLTSDKRRHEAIRFYEGLGFKASHEGFKLRLSSD
jgi:ribosomal protein S18 acetylase RimI-like enzyme